MATNFKISIRQQCNHLQLGLAGDFDGSSAYELLNAIRKRGGSVTRISINTDSLRNIHPFGKDIFHNNLYLLDTRTVALEFTGKKALKLQTTEPCLWRGV